MQECNVCKKWLDKKHFGKDSSRKDGLKYRCKDCYRKTLNASRRKKRKAENERLAIQGKKRCSKCEEYLDTSEFYKHNRTKDELYPHCKKCHIEYQKGKEQYITKKITITLQIEKELRLKEKKEQEELKKMMESHSCYGCVWGRCIAKKYVCMFPSCQNSIEQLRKVQ